MKKCLLIWLFIPVFSVYPKENIDSVMHFLRNKSFTSYKEEIKFLENTASYKAAYDMELARAICRYARRRAEKENDTYYIAHFNLVISSTYTYQSVYDTSFIYLEKALTDFKKINDKKGESGVYGGMANNYIRQGDIATAHTYYMKVLDLYKYTGATWNYIVTLGNIGNIYRKLNNPERAVYYFEEARKFAEESDVLTGKLIAYCGLGKIYMEQGKLDQAFEYMNIVISLIGGNSPVFGSRANETIAEICIMRGNYEKALEHAAECLRYAEMLNDTNLFCIAWNLYATIYLKQNRYEEAEHNAMKAWLADSVSVDTGPAITLNVAWANIQLGNTRRASEFLIKNAAFNKKRMEKSLHETLLGMEIKYETERKEARISSLEKEKKLFFISGSIGVVLFLSVILLLVFRHRLLKSERTVVEQQAMLAEQKITQLEQEKQIIAAQAAQDSEIAERIRLARDLHDGLGGILSAAKLNLDDKSNLPNARKLLDKSITELRRIAHHMMPETLSLYGLKSSLQDFCASFPNVRFHFYGKDIRINKRVETLIYHCAYELVNNAIKYAQAERIYVQLVQEESRVSLSVQDNGKGFNPDITSKGTGLRNLKDRIVVANGTIDIHALEGSGTDIYIQIILQNVENND